MAESVHVRLAVNGTRYEREVEPRLLLSDFLRHDLLLTGTHVGCEHGVCGACTILVNGEAMRSCLIFAVQADGTDITTVEGLTAPDGRDLHPLQEAFREEHGLQCGFCTPGILMTLVPFLAEHPSPNDTEIREALAAHLCRCTGYANIVAAVKRVAGNRESGVENRHGTPDAARSADGATGQRPRVIEGSPRHASPITRHDS